MGRCSVVVAVLVVVSGILSLLVGPAPVAAQQEQPLDTVITVDVQENGDAVWRVSNRYQLSSDEEQQAFRAIETDIEENETQVAQTFKSRFQTGVVEAEDETGRNMTIQNVSVTTSRDSFPEEYGVVTYELTWTNFARTTDDGLVVGDAIRGFYVSQGTSLTIRAPDGYALTAVEPSPDSQSEEPARVVWEGPTAFTTDEPTVRATTATAGNGFPTQVVMVGVVAFGLVLAVLLAALRSSALGGVLRSDSEGTDTSDEGEEDVATPSENLLSNEEQVLQLLDENGGRMKQQTIVQETGWSDAKTSNVLSDLESDGKVDKFQLGRENVISLPDTEVDPTSDLYDEERDS